MWPEDHLLVLNYNVLTSFLDKSVMCNTSWQGMYHQNKPTCARVAAMITEAHNKSKQQAGAELGQAQFMLGLAKVAIAM